MPEAVHLPFVLPSKMNSLEYLTSNSFILILLYIVVHMLGLP